ncbi:unnamed protein product [Kuraishia capsulata CBS 1993]|uniref:Nitrogen permease regulator 3 n=1 Tax=Kuraishia capsulata CBS 1993 TaxID=1382522 RepID=W6MSJ2_9ASCO|nr:uncharacterized protein KUCA_T00000726001 [Kuraishia capsulata CBS 1993]CDK24760.1 unnamed protein product [Kuraishia capsulata CBS 1993]
MTSLYLPNPCLLGILFTISTHDGHQLVFNYPPNPNEYGYKATPLAQQLTDLHNGEDYSTSSSSGEDESGDDDGQFSSDLGSSTDENTGSGRSSSGAYNGGNNYLSGRALLDMLDEQDRKRKKKESKRRNLMKHILNNEREAHGDASTVLSNGDDASKASSMNNSGTLGSLPNTKSLASNNNDKDSDAGDISKVFGFDIDFLSEVVSPPKGLCNTRFELTVNDMAFLGLPIHVHDDGNWRTSTRKHVHHSKSKTKGRSRKDSRAIQHKRSKRSIANENDGADSGPENNESDGELGSDDADEANDCPMHMFHLVFVMNPPVMEYNYRTDEMYHYVVSRLSLVLRYEQQKNNYIWHEASKILKLRESLSSMSINEKWNQIIEQSSLANVIAKTYRAISNSEIVNVEINGKMRSFQIPTKTEFKSLPLRTTPVLPGSTLSSISPTGDADLDQNSDTEGSLVYFALILLDDAETIIRDIGAEKDSVIASFIRMIKPTENLIKLSSQSGLELSQAQVFANHLVYWRRAKAILPLQARNVYIVSPMAPFENMFRDMELFKQQFPSLPLLPSFLSLISSSNKPRQLSLIIPSRDHKDLYLDAVSWLIKSGYLCHLHTFLWLKISKKIKMEVDEELEKEGATKKFYDGSVDTSSQYNASSGDASGKSGIRKVTDNTSKDGPVNPYNRPLLTSSGSNISDDLAKLYIEEEEEETILLDPESASALERRWIAKCVEGQPPDVSKLFYRILKYMNGRNALEMFMTKDNISRQDLRKLLVSLESHIVTVRHW